MAGVPSARGGTWSADVVRQIARNPAYCGERYGVKKAHPAIVGRRLWNQAQAVLKERARG